MIFGRNKIFQKRVSTFNSVLKPHPCFNLKIKSPPNFFSLKITNTKTNGMALNFAKKHYSTHSSDPIDSHQTVNVEEKKEWKAKVKAWLGPKPSYTPYSSKWWLDKLLICVIFGITGTSAVYFVRPRIYKYVYGIEGFFTLPFLLFLLSFLFPFSPFFPFSFLSPFFLSPFSSPSLNSFKDGKVTTNQRVASIFLMLPFYYTILLCVSAVMGRFDYCVKVLPFFLLIILFLL